MEKLTRDLWYDFADCSHGQMVTRGLYRKGYPEGAVIHFTAGRSRDDADAIQMTKMAEQRGHCYFVISSTGKVFQSFPLNSWGNHAGPSKWPGLGEGLSRYLVGIELCCAGKLSESTDGLISWYGERFKPDVTRTVEARDNAPAGIYHKYTEAQEKSLVDLLLWLKTNWPQVFDLNFVLGHSEIAIPPGRKSDPGGSLSMSMPDFRAHLKLLYEASLSLGRPSVST